ncbi:SDR family NAD(P)-dependent oxidoreductase [Streptomyces sp. NPDC057623]|uniref:SDR family NAD(P)-dependent oxidoreductase n=1 Tax=Streptomyces sp. NPDC057623 TaxID=3346187 RepID=UPI0036B665F8
MTGINDFRDRVAVVTGGASGIGKALAARLVVEGASVVIADNDEDLATKTAEEIGATPYRVDVSDASAVQELADWTVARFGRVDFVANNAGVGPLAPFDELTLEDFRWVLDINLYGVLHGMKAFLPLLKANPAGGHILNTSSMAGLMATHGMSAYSASKYAVVALTEAVRAELEGEGSSVGLSVVTPAQVKSNIGDNSRKRPGLKERVSNGSNDDHLPEARWMEADVAAGIILDGVRRGDLYIVTHPELLAPISGRLDEIVKAFEAAAAR